MFWCGCSASPPATGASLTYNRDIAPLLWARCGGCHRPGQMAPFSVLEYADVRPRATAIASATARRAMPPWLPEPGYGAFANARLLTAEEIALVNRWVDEGAAEGAPSDRQAAPTWTEGWQLGTPDAVVELPTPYTLHPGRRDEFRNFVVPIPTASVRYVRGIEVRPGNPHVVHHATLGVDGSQSSRLLDEADPEPGYEGMFSSGAHSPDSHALGWTPGMTPRLDPPETAWRLEAGSDLVIQLHMMPMHLAEPTSVRPRVGFYFTDAPPSAETIDFKLGSKSIDIPAGEANHVVQDTYRLPVDVDVLSIYPHAHYLAREMKVFAALPDGRVEWLLWIRKWNFNWQDQYQYARPVSLPAGTMLTMLFTYDNSTANPHNPSRPPVRVSYGPQSSDEMGDVWLRFLPRRHEDARVLAQSFIQNETRKDLEAAERRVRDHPDDGSLFGLLGARYVQNGRLDDGLAALRRARRLSPRDAEIRNNLGLALRQKGFLQEATQEFTAALRLAPRHADIRMNLADALQDAGDLAGAIRHLRAALALDPGDAEPHNNLGVALASSGDITSALAEFRRALEIRPDYADARANVAMAEKALQGR